MQPYAPQDVTANGVKHKLSDLIGITRCRWFQVVGTSVANSAIPGRVGDTNVTLDVTSPVTLGRGFPIQSSGAQFSPPVSDVLEGGVYDLDLWYLIGNSGDIFSVGCVV